MHQCTGEFFWAIQNQRIQKQLFLSLHPGSKLCIVELAHTPHVCEPQLWSYCKKTQLDRTLSARLNIDKLTISSISSFDSFSPRQLNTLRQYHLLNRDFFPHASKNVEDGFLAVPPLNVLSASR